MEKSCFQWTGCRLRGHPCSFLTDILFFGVKISYHCLNLLLSSPNPRPILNRHPFLPPVRYFWNWALLDDVQSTERDSASRPGLVPHVIQDCDLFDVSHPNFWGGDLSNYRLRGVSRTWGLDSSMLPFASSLAPPGVPQLDVVSFGGASLHH